MLYLIMPAVLLQRFRNKEADLSAGYVLPMDMPDSFSLCGNEALRTIHKTNTI